MEFTTQHGDSSTRAPEVMQTPIEVSFSTQIHAPTLTQSFVQASSSQVTAHPPPALPLQNTLIPLTLKLDYNNFAIWRSLVFPAIRALDLEGFLDGSRVCPTRFVLNLNGEGSSNGE